MSKKAKVTVHPSFQIGEISKRLFSAFLEPIGTLVNGNMYYPGHPEADEQGFRKDWIEGIREAGVPAVRLPGGNFVSGWNWKDSIGSKENRKKHVDIAWRQYYDNAVGHDEYLQWAEKAGVEPLYTVNAGSGSLQDAIDLIEYTNFPGETYWSELRKKNGHEAPYGVKMWYIGNEMDGPWQIGSGEKDPKGYGAKVNEFSKCMKGIDSSIETAVCVSCTPNTLHYPSWDMEVLKQCYDTVDYVSMHNYHEAEIGNYAQFLGAAAYFEDYIRTEIGICDYVQELNRSPKKMMLSLDEYGVMERTADRMKIGRDPYHNSGALYFKYNHFPYVKHDPDKMPDEAWNGEHTTMLTALGNATVGLVMLNHADRVKIGCMTDGLRTAADCDKEHVWKNIAYYPYEDLIRYATGISLRTAVEAEKFDVEDYATDNCHMYHEQTGIDLVASAAAYDENAGRLAVFVLNRDWEDTADFTLDVQGLSGYRFKEHRAFFTEDPRETTPYGCQKPVLPVKDERTTAEGTLIHAELQKLSWNLFLFEKN